jgi:hypothetical protein
MAPFDHGLQFLTLGNMHHLQEVLSIGLGCALSRKPRTSALSKASGCFGAGNSDSQIAPTGNFGY